MILQKRQAADMVINWTFNRVLCVGTVCYGEDVERGGNEAVRNSDGIIVGKLASI